MGYEKAKTRFTDKVRVDPQNLQWLREHKDTRTIAGYLDKIINEHKKQHGRQKQITPSGEL